MVPGDHDVFVCGNDARSKAVVVGILNSFGWKSPIDLGDIKSARAVEMMLPIWVGLMMTYQNPMYNFKIAR